MPAYNNYFPVNYQPMAYQQTQQVTPTSSIIWVQGEAGAKAYPVAAGNSMILMDSESELFYLKTTDISGMPMPLRVFKYKEVVGTSEPVANKDLDLSKYITKDELETHLERLKTNLEQLKNSLKKGKVRDADE